jgi:hypothetical protein
MKLTVTSATTIRSVQLGAGAVVERGEVEVVEDMGPGCTGVLDMGMLTD